MSSKLGVLLIVFIIFFTLSAVLVLIFEVAENSQFSNFLDSLWWAVITISTTGYGDKVPISTGGRIVAIISIFLGLGIISILSGTMASVFVDRNTQARRGLMELRRIKDHIIICGWKDHMMEILRGIIKANPGFTSDDIVIISNIDAERIGEMKEEKDLRRLRFVKGDYFAESSLMRANVKTARKVLVLADTLESRAISEVDSKTVIAVLTIRDIARDVYICVELLDRKYEHNLKQAMCDEIILIRDHNNLLLASSSVTSGISHVVHGLLDTEMSGSQLTTCVIPEEYVGQPYVRFRDFKFSSSCLPLGVLENAGSPHAMKIEALRAAQQTSDVSRLVSNLHEVKSLEVNKPVLHPADDYIVPRHAMGIVLEKVEPSAQGVTADG